MLKILCWKVLKLPANNRHLQVTIHGRVQGVGFRPFLYRLAVQYQLHGWVKNTSQGVLLDIQGEKEKIAAVLERIRKDAPPLAEIVQMPIQELPLAKNQGFAIVPSEPSALSHTRVMPDIASCSECIQEVFAANNRRYLYPFTNCTHCGPRYSIIEKLPYDRDNTTMKLFTMCQECQAEYHDPANRRFHAQPNACARCGPHVELWDFHGQTLAEHHQAMEQAAVEILNGNIVAVKGLGGFHLVVDARNCSSIARLRQAKARNRKPLALMVPSLAFLEVNPAEKKLLTSPAAPILLVPKENLRSVRTSDRALTGNLSKLLAPDNPYLGVMLPYTPLHHILLRLIGRPVVVTSGNFGEESLVFCEQEAMKRLGKMASLLLVHNRPIFQPIDDSVVKMAAGKEMVVRRARGYAPTYFSWESKPALALGAEQKNTVALAIGSEICLSPHLGDLETLSTRQSLERMTRHLTSLHQITPKTAVVDWHPDYYSTQLAPTLCANVVSTQHHYAHLLACMHEHNIAPPVLGVCWDGTGYGSDGSIWGGEFLRITDEGFERIGHLRPFALLGGEQAIKDIRRVALALLYEVFGSKLWSQSCSLLSSLSRQEKAVFAQMLEKKLRSVLTSSAGRLFDGVACLLGLCSRNDFQGDAAMQVEFAATTKAMPSYPFEIYSEAEKFVLDWREIIREIVRDNQQQVPLVQIATRFHHTLAEMIYALAERVAERCIVVAGGCFQNACLLECLIQRFSLSGCQIYWPQQIPPHDGGIALGQIVSVKKEPGRVLSDSRKNH